MSTSEPVTGPLVPFDPAETGGGLPEPVARAVYAVLVTHARASAASDDVEHFVHAQTKSHRTGHRFGGALGFGGKFCRNVGFRRDGSWGEIWYVNYYGETRNDESDAAMAATDEALADLLEVCGPTRS